MNKHPFLTVVLGFIPGLGHLYAGRLLRAFLYACVFFGLVLMTMFVQSQSGGDHFPTLVFFAFGVIVWFINMIDLIVYVTGSSRRDTAIMNPDEPNPIHNESQQNERFFTMLSSIIPGLGHFQMGLMQRGLSFLVAFFGVITMIFFVRYVTHLEGVFVFLLAVPIIWLYGLFDSMQLLHRKQKGEVLVDRTIFDEFEEGREVGKKSKTLAIILSILPGAGHMYLGLQYRGLQLMAGFLFSFYILDALHLSIFLFLIPILWFYSLFDAMQHVSRHGVVEIKDIPIIDWLKNYQKWIGIGLLVLGFYHLLDEFVLGVFDRLQPELQISYWFHRYFQVFVVSTLLIGGGFRLLTGTSAKTNVPKKGE
ncbi:MAG: hypothetical protein WD469_00170 [Paenibacillaceae bacterium]